MLCESLRSPRTGSLKPLAVGTSFLKSHLHTTGLRGDVWEFLAPVATFRPLGPQPLVQALPVNPCHLGVSPHPAYPCCPQTFSWDLGQLAHPPCASLVHSYSPGVGQDIRSPGPLSSSLLETTSPLSHLYNSVTLCHCNNTNSSIPEAPPPAFLPRPQTPAPLLVQ